jgi:microcystin-dependent protein
MPIAFNYAPRGWALCNGQILPINQNQALFSLLGTTYGGNGQTTFALPDMRGRVANSSGQGPGLAPYALGERGGVEGTTLAINELPTHRHAVSAASTPLDVSPTGNLPAVQKGHQIYATPPNSALAADTIAPRGGSQPHNNMQPYLCINYVIALVGVFPSH